MKRYDVLQSVDGYLYIEESDTGEFFRCEDLPEAMEEQRRESLAEACRFLEKYGKSTCQFNYILQIITSRDFTNSMLNATIEDKDNER